MARAKRNQKPALLPEGSSKPSNVPVSPGRATYFLHAQKVGTDAHRGTNPSDKGRPPGFDPLRTPVFTGEQNWCVTLTTGVRLLTHPATQGGSRPFAVLPYNLLHRLWAPHLGVQACWPAPLTAYTPKCPAIPGAPVGRRYQSVRTQEAGGRRGNRRSRESRPPESERGTATDAPVALSGVLRGWADCEQGPALGGRSRTGGTPPKPPFGSFRAVPKGTRPSGRNRKASAGTRPGKPEGSGHPRQKEKSSRAPPWGYGGCAPKARGPSGPYRVRCTAAFSG